MVRHTVWIDTRQSVKCINFEDELHPKNVQWFWKWVFVWQIVSKSQVKSCQFTDLGQSNENVGQKQFTIVDNVIAKRFWRNLIFLFLCFVLHSKSTHNNVMRSSECGYNYESFFARKTTATPTKQTTNKRADFLYKNDNNFRLISLQSSSRVCHIFKLCCKL